MNGDIEKANITNHLNKINYQRTPSEDAVPLSSDHYDDYDDYDDPLESEIWDDLPSTLTDSETSVRCELGNQINQLTDHNSQQVQTYDLGEIPIVQTRFEMLLKHRLKPRIEKNLPLFPWETPGYQYESELETVNQLRGDMVSERLWLTQLQKLKLPIELPEDCLAKLLAACQEVAGTTMQHGAKLVRAVERLFPGQSQSLNQLAQLVLMSPVRSPLILSEESIDSGNFPSSYECAQPVQQITLALLAAKEILKDLTINVVTNGSPVKRQWQTQTGPLKLTLEHLRSKLNNACRLKVEVYLPKAGSLIIQRGTVLKKAQIKKPGIINQDLFDQQVGLNYKLEVRLSEFHQIPLIFYINPSPSTNN